MSDSESSAAASTDLPIKRKRDSEDDAIPQDDDQPPLSHAEKRRQRKKEKLLAREVMSETKKKTKGSKEQTHASKDITVPPGREKRQNSVWVGNLSFKTTINDIKQFFADVGEPIRIHMPTKAGATPEKKPENRGFAYVDFITPELKDAAIAKSEQQLLGRRLLIKDGNNFEGRPAPPTGNSDPPKITHSKFAQKVLKEQKKPPCPTLFLGNLGFNTTEASILELFNAHRKKPSSEQANGDDEKDTQEQQDNWIRKVRLGTFEDSGQCKGFAFVDFTTTEHATSVLVNPKNHHLDGRKLVVEYASPDAVRRGGGPRQKNSTKPNEHRKSDEQQSKSDSPKKRKHDVTEKDMPANEDQSGTTEVENGRPKKAPKRERSRSQPQGSSRSRPKPGAALALAKRESAAIIPTTGKKIVF